ncbi:hypothetical protein IX56_02970 [Paracoccus sanguinis]|uniref:Uncharacterized protein n=1 Tax=Paracoccus sanguinis TaxID=1545044 RepID=A0A099GMA2_9RHOB|nr:hypothetical protein IX56_02970 [Paracoccus sanguinis]
MVVAAWLRCDGAVDCAFKMEYLLPVAIPDLGFGCDQSAPEQACDTFLLQRVPEYLREASWKAIQLLQEQASLFYENWVPQ